MRNYLTALCFTCSVLFSSLCVSDEFHLNGFSETVIIVSELETTTNFLKEVAGWHIIEQDQMQGKIQSQANNKLSNLWQLPDSAKIKQRLMSNKGATTGFIRLIQIEGVKQQRIRSNTQSWDVGGIFDINVRVKDMDKKFEQLQKLGWTSATNPIQFTFGPFVVKEWIVKNADGVAFALIERLKPELEGWPNLKEFSRVFNSTQVVNNIEKSLDFYQNVLGFKTYLEHRGASKTEGPNVLGLPHNISTQVERSVYILHPQGKNEGSVELLQFHGATGRDVSSLAKPPNIGIATLRFEVNDLDKLLNVLQKKQIKIQNRVEMNLPPYGLVDILAIRTPDNTWLEFYQKR